MCDTDREMLPQIFAWFAFPKKWVSMKFGCFSCLLITETELSNHYTRTVNVTRLEWLDFSGFDPVVFSGEERQQQGSSDPGSGQPQHQAWPHLGPRDLPGHPHQRNTLPQLWNGQWKKRHLSHFLLLAVWFLSIDCCYCCCCFACCWGHVFFFFFFFWGGGGSSVC